MKIKRNLPSCSTFSIMIPIPFYDAILASGNFNVAVNKRYKQRMETVVQTRNPVMLQIKFSVLLNFTIHKKIVRTKSK